MRTVPLVARDDCNRGVRDSLLFCATRNEMPFSERSGPCRQFLILSNTCERSSPILPSELLTERFCLLQSKFQFQSVNSVEMYSTVNRISILLVSLGCGLLYKRVHRPFLASLPHTCQLLINVIAMIEIDKRQCSLPLTSTPHDRRCWRMYRLPTACQSMSCFTRFFLFSPSHS